VVKSLAGGLWEKKVRLNFLSWLLPFVILYLVGVSLVFAFPAIAAWLPRAIGW